MKNTFTKFLSIVLAVFMCMSTLVIGASAETECTHANSTYYGEKAATCTEMGGKLWKCNDCGKEYATDVTNKLGHDISNKQTVDATCEADAYTEGTCSRCGEKEKVTFPGTKLDHVAIEVTVQPDCATGEAGYIRTECKNCGTVLGQSATLPGKHVWVIMLDTFQAPTCTADGKISYACKNEGCDHVEVVKIDKLGHSTIDVAAVEPTCTVAGVAAHKKCTTCNALFKAALSNGNLVATTEADLVVAPAHPESSCTVISTVPGTCTAKAVTTHKCLKCAAEWTTTGEYGHTWKKHETQASCYKYGYINYFCDLCGVKYHNEANANDPMNEKVTAPLGHSYTVGTTAPVAGPFAPTCEEPGYAVYNCTRCGNHNEIDATKPALGHDMQISTAEKAPVCGVAGATAIYTCANGCGKTVGGTAIDALEHKYVDKVIPQTCLDDGYTTSVCEYCGVEKANAEKKDIVKADGVSHKMTSEVIVEETCDKDGSLRRYCEICDGNDTLEAIPATGHNFNKEADLVVPGTCVERGYSIYACMNGNCDALTTVFGDYDYSPEGHENAMGGVGTNPVVLREGTCTVKGLIKYTCTVCAENYDKNTDYCTTSDHNRTEMPALAPDCTVEKDGYADDGIKCTKCDKWVIEPTVVKYEHVLDGTCAAQAETCTADGWSEFAYCTVCEASGKADAKACTAVLKVADANKIKAHGDTYKANVAAQAETCEANGWKAFTYCTKCENLEAAKKLPANIIDEISGHSYAVTTAALSVVAKNGCVDYSFTCQVCVHCNGLRIVDYVAAKSHDWVKGTVVAPTCDEEGYTPYTCACGAEEKRDVLPATGHINVKDEKFYGFCDDTVTDRVCKACGFTVTEATEKHTFETLTVQLPTCDAPGYTIAICTRENCDEQLLDNYVEKLGHVKGNLLADKSKAPSYTEAGYNVYACAHGCGTELTEDIPVLKGVNVTIKADSGILEDADIINGGLVKFVVTLETANLEANTLLASIEFDSDVLTFVSAEINDIFGGGYEYAVAVEDVTEIDTKGVVRILSYANDTKDVTLNGEIAYATLTFKVSATAENSKTAVTVLPIDFKNADTETAATSEAATETVNIVKLGDVNADGVIDIVDTQLVRKVIAGEIEDVEYLAVADVNMDGEVSIKDFSRLAKYIVGELSYEELVLNK